MIEKMVNLCILYDSIFRLIGKDELNDTNNLAGGKTSLKMQ